MTDSDWAAHLRADPTITEANFWYPNPTGAFRALSSGEYFLFKSKWPDNRLIGGGYLSGYALLKVSEAWTFFGTGNGVATHSELLAKIQHYRKDLDPDPTIGCVMLRDIFFSEVMPEAPSDFARNIVRFKTYNLADPSGSHLENSLRTLLSDVEPRSASVPGPMFGDPRMIQPRLGQQAFKGLVLAAYERRCAITGGKITPVLEAAHIRPVSQDGQHSVSNGLLLRSDVHTLFDRGYLGIDTRHRLQVSPRLRMDFGNGREFYEHMGTTLEIPARRAHRPSGEALTWHMDTVFQHS